MHWKANLTFGTWEYWFWVRCPLSTENIMRVSLIDNVLHNGTFHCIVQLANPASGRRNATHSSENWQRRSGLQKKQLRHFPWFMNRSVETDLLLVTQFFILLWNCENLFGKTWIVRLQCFFHKHWKFNFLFLICPSLEGKIILSAGVNVLYKFWTDKTLDISESERKGWRSHSFLKNSKTYSIYLDLKWDTSKRLIQFQTKTLQNIPSGKRKHQSLCVMKYRLRDLVNCLTFEVFSDT